MVNKIVWHSMAGAATVNVDRNCHKSLLHSLDRRLARRRSTSRPAQRLRHYWPDRLDQFSPEATRKKVQASPTCAATAANVRIAVVTNSTYDGLLWHAEKIKAKVADQVDALHFDEARYAYARVPRVLRRPPPRMGVPAATRAPTTHRWSSATHSTH